MCSDGENGLVELLALSDTTLISMERACLTTKDKQFTANTVQLFSVELVGGDARKRLLLDFDSLHAAAVVGAVAAGELRGDDVRSDRQRHADAA